MQKLRPLLRPAHSPVCLFPSWSHFTLFPSNSLHCWRLLPRALWDGEDLQREEWTVHSQWGCGPCSDLGWIRIPGNRVHFDTVLWLPKHLTFQQMLPPAKAQIHRALTQPLINAFFPAAHSTSKLRWPVRLERKEISKSQTLAKDSCLHHNHTQLWDLRLDSLKFSALVVWQLLENHKLVGRRTVNPG